MKLHPSSPGDFSLVLALSIIASLGSSAAVPTLPFENTNSLAISISGETSNIADTVGQGDLAVHDNNDNVGSDYSTDPALFSIYVDIDLVDIDSVGTSGNNTKDVTPSAVPTRRPPIRAFVDPLISSDGSTHVDHVIFPQNYFIPDGTGLLRWSCVYNKNNVVMTPLGTQISITHSDGLSIPAPPGSNRPAHPGRPYNCGEMVMKNRGVGYGTYSVDMISTDLRGHVTAMFLIAHDQGEAGTEGSEIDIELTGLDPTVVWLTVWKGTTQYPVRFPLGFDASKGWHIYSVKWQPGFIAWSIDGGEVLRRTDLWTADPRAPGVEYKLALNSWTHDMEEDLWAGKFQWPKNRQQPVMGQFRNLKFIPTSAR